MLAFEALNLLNTLKGYGGLRRLCSSGPNIYLLQNVGAVGDRTVFNLVSLSSGRKAFLLDLRFNICSDAGFVSNSTVFMQDCRDWSPRVAFDGNVISNADGRQATGGIQTPNLSITDCIESVSMVPSSFSPGNIEIVAFCRVPLYLPSPDGCTIQTYFERIGTVTSQSYQAAMKLDYFMLR